MSPSSALLITAICDAASRDLESDTIDTLQPRLVYALWWPDPHAACSVRSWVTVQTPDLSAVFDQARHLAQHPPHSSHPQEFVPILHHMLKTVPHWHITPLARPSSYPAKIALVFFSAS
jgi:hypothetical protein